MSFNTATLWLPWACNNAAASGRNFRATYIDGLGPLAQVAALFVCESLGLAVPDEFGLSLVFCTVLLLSRFSDKAQSRSI